MTPAVTVGALPYTPLPLHDVLAEAHDFLRMRHSETGEAGFHNRWREVRAEIDATGTWRQSMHELTWGARVAWRNSARCVGRLRWHSLHVRDRRHLHELAAVRNDLAGHLHQATGDGRVRSIITIYPPAPAERPPLVRIVSPQLARYAAWPTGTTILGDPANLGLTRVATTLGWRGPSPRTPFDLLPWIVATDDGHLHILPVDSAAIREVPIQHPEHPWVAHLGLRWPAIPVISNMLLAVGGLRYPVLFNGFFMASEIATRNLADGNRYHQLPAITTGLNLDPRDPLRQDKALLVLLEAVLHSYKQAGVTVTDHHTESRHFARFVRREEAAGRTVAGDWSWLNSYPMTPQDPSWIRYYGDPLPQPSFYLDPAADALIGRPSCPHTAAPPAAVFTGSSPRPPRPAASHPDSS